jgi:hypothetical protein
MLMSVVAGAVVMAAHVWVRFGETREIGTLDKQECVRRAVYES